MDGDHTCGQTRPRTRIGHRALAVALAAGSLMSGLNALLQLTRTIAAALGQHG